MLSVVIPAYNEQGAIAKTIADVKSALEAAKESDFEIIVIDDGSTDGTAAAAQVAGATVISKLQNMGYGHSLKTGIEAARHDTILILDGDGTYPADRIEPLLAKYREGYHMVVGERTGEHYRESLIKSPLRRMLKLLVEFTAGRTIPDVNSGMRVFSRAEIMPVFPFLSNAFSFTTSSTLAYMLRSRYVAYIPIPYHERIGQTKVRLFRDSLRVLQYIFSAILFYNPVKLFIVICLCLSAVGIPAFVIGILAGSNFWIGWGLAIELTATLVFAAGLAVDAMRQYAMRPPSPPEN